MMRPPRSRSLSTSPLPADGQHIYREPAMNSFAPLPNAHSPLTPPSLATPAFQPAANPLGGGRSPSTAAPDHEPYDPVRGERGVWRAVILQALIDAACLSHKKESIQSREEALIWLRGTSQDFYTVCHYAGFEPEYVRRMVRGCLERQCSWRAAPGSGAPRKHRPLKSSHGRRPNQRR